ncbi:Chromatin structure-remodeling complex protein [Wickerhamomyces ciferrii]|uniref:Chromatin structure-remodeling complex protein n=1 Tax=Wickerhamomyces ciferrii (strain ATCC 14091 / BCRC 22168 / CBS 111 / JCM 3599 / NBRC 0793 / NRRL Y-1031 F-60-10) TaxID=1206466 RepID=K0KM31_WICCF|nr:Chromatin structure-remodeling complex protein [Wickerhamomyces ciferrii]CCH42183.1 Chromatin structure-remodeling complex protein [Wickerhamomyces ciferrii]
MAKKQVQIQPKHEPGSNSFRITKPNHHNISSSISPSSSTGSSPLLDQTTLLADTFNNISTTDVFMPMASDSSLPKPKILKSCIRCRKHKTKCNASELAPNPCSSCAKKGIQCKIDYVLPPQRSDNLKNLVGQVDNIKKNYQALEDYYTKISNKLDIKIESFEDWKASKQANMSTTTSSNDQTSSCEDHHDSNETSHESYNLIKLSDGSFISINLLDAKHLCVNNKIISIDEFQKKLNKLCSRLNFLYQTANLNDHYSTPRSSSRQNSNLTNDLDSSTDDNSSIASPVSVLNNNTSSYQQVDDASSEFGHEFFEQVCQIGSGILTLNDQNEFSTTDKAIQSNMHDVDFKLTPENLNQYNSDFKPTSSTSWFDLNFNVEEIYKNNKFLLIQLIGFFYPNDQYINPTSQLNYELFLQDYLNSYYQIIENQNKASNSSTYSSFLINSIPGYHLIFNKDQLKNLINCEIFNSEIFLKKLIQLLFLNTLLYGIDENFTHLTKFISFIEKNINSNRKKISFDKDSNLRFIDQYIKLFKSLENHEHDDLIPINLSNMIENYYNLLQTNLKFIEIQDDSSNTSLFQSRNNNSIQLNKMKELFSRFILQWSNYFQFYINDDSDNLNLFIDNFLIETFIINCLIFINEGFEEFNSILIEFLTTFNLQNEELLKLIELFKKNDGPTNIDLNNKFSCLQFSSIISKLILNKKHNINLQINDIQIILENVDWKKESTDDVLKKIGVI